MLFLESTELLRQPFLLTLNSGPLDYQTLHFYFVEFLDIFKITYEAYMFFQGVHSDREELITADWALPLPQI